MTTINTIEDLMRLLDESPEWLETVRARLLTRELLEFPGKFAQFAETANRRLEKLEELPDKVDQLSNDFTQFAETSNQRLGQIVDDLGRLKNVGTITTTRDHAEVIAEVVGLHCQKQLRRNEIIALSRNQNTAGITPGDLTSFHRADLIMEATDANGELHYIAVEASFTADGRDTRRAIRNASYLTRFTERPARAVIAAMRIDREIQGDLDSSRVFWYQLAEEDSD